MRTNLFKKLFLLLPLATYQPLSNSDGSANNTDWNYKENGADWGGICAMGLTQTPIKLSVDSSFIKPLPRIIFENYDVKLDIPPTLVNKGYTLDMKISKTRNGKKPFITGGVLKGKYAAEGVHFHWGSPVSRGSEHSVNNRSYDVEMHIVHRNVRYDNIAEALNHPDGLAVLSIMFKTTNRVDRIYPGHKKIFNELPKLVEYHSEVELPYSITLGQLLGDLNTREFFTYQGSLTTPNCNEAVTWTVFAQPLPISYSDVSKLWQLQDSNGDIIQNNFRELQSQNNRRVFYRTSKNLHAFNLG